MKKYHYTYFLHLTNGQYYIGVRTSLKMPVDDSKYLGSSKYIKKHQVISKGVIRVFKTRIDAINHEIELHNRYDVVKNPLFANRSKQKTDGFDTTGLPTKGRNLGYKHNEDARKNMGDSHRDKTVYTFYHLDGRCVICTRQQLCETYGVNAATLGEVIRGYHNRKTAGGWALKSGVRRVRNRPRLISVVNKKTNEIFTGTHYDFADKLGCRYSRITDLINGRGKSYLGWCLVN